MQKPYKLTMPNGIELNIELKGRPVDMELVVPSVGTVSFQRKQGGDDVKGEIDFSGIPAANHSKVGKTHTVLTASGDSITFSDPEM